jgi:hypothetical protein
MSGRKGAIALSTCALAFALSFGAISAQAAACKGLEMEPCQNSEDCSWVDSYERKDGVKVSAHCKSKPNPSRSQKKTESKKKSESKD